MKSLTVVGSAAGVFGLVGYLVAAFHSRKIRTKILLRWVQFSGAMAVLQVSSWILKLF